jgi:hypothetical protein
MNKYRIYLEPKPQDVKYLKEELQKLVSLTGEDTEYNKWIEFKEEENKINSTLESLSKTLLLSYPCRVFDMKTKQEIVEIPETAVKEMNVYNSEIVFQNALNKCMQRWGEFEIYMTRTKTSVFYSDGCFTTLVPAAYLLLKFDSIEDKGRYSVSGYNRVTKQNKSYLEAANSSKIMLAVVEAEKEAKKINENAKLSIKSMYSTDSF